MGAKVIVQRALSLVGLEVYRSDPYGLRRARWLCDQPVCTIIDVGAHRGEFARAARQSWPRARIYSFEPQHDAFVELQRVISTLRNARAFNLAIGDSTGTAVIRRNLYSPSSSLLPLGALHRAHFPNAREAHEESVNVTTLDAILSDLDLRDDLLLKIDTQGYEDRVLAGGRTTVPQCRYVLVEASFRPLYVGQALFDDLYKRLRNLGFHYRGDLGQLRSPLDGSVLQVDALFSRDQSPSPHTQ